MTDTEQLRRIAVRAGIMGSHGTQVPMHKLEAFASLLLDEENEGCAEAVDIMRRDTPMGLSSRADALFHAANTIRARRKS